MFSICTDTSKTFLKISVNKSKWQRTTFWFYTIVSSYWPIQLSTFTLKFLHRLFDKLQKTKLETFLIFIDFTNISVI